MPAGKFAQCLQTDGLITGIKNLVVLAGQEISKPALNGGHDEVVNRVAAGLTGSLNPLPQQPATVADKNELAAFGFQLAANFCWQIDHLRLDES